MPNTYLRLRPDGAYEEVLTVDTSEGAADADEIPSLNADGILDPSIVGADTTGNSVVLMTGPDGRIDTSVLPAGVGVDTASIVASEGLSAGNWVNVYDNAGTAGVRRADSGAGRPANGFVLESYDATDPARVYFEGFNTAMSGLTPGIVYLSATTPGGSTNTAPSGSGQLLQILGTAYSATTVYFKPERPVYLA
jgi:hypothetical protein